MCNFIEKTTYLFVWKYRLLKKSKKTMHFYFNLYFYKYLVIKKHIFMRTLILFSTIVFFSLLTISNIQAQNKSKKETVTITTLDGNIYTGKILKQTEKTIRIKTTSAGVLTIKKKKIKSIDFDPSSSSSNAVSQYRSYPSKYFLGTSGYNLKKGEGYYGNTWIFFNEINYGITDNLSIGAGTIPLFIFNGAPTPVWLKTKVSLPIVKNKINISGGAMAGAIIGEEFYSDNTFLWLYSAGTLGSKEKNISFSINFIYGGGGWSPALFTLSGKYKVSHRTYLLTDNYLSFDTNGLGDGIFSFLGARTAFKGISLDYGGIVPIGAGIFDVGIYIVPYLGIKIGFGR